MSAAIEIFGGALVPFNAEGFPLMFEAGDICICAECASLIAARVAYLRPVTVWQGALECEACKEMIYAVGPASDLEEEEEEEGQGRRMLRLAVGTWREVYLAQDIGRADYLDSDWEADNSDAETVGSEDD
jgi:hypothetical protein